MLENNIFIKKRRILTIVIVFNILICSIVGIMNQNNVYATQSKENVSSKLSKYPGYTELINKLRSEHPKWNFTILYTGLDWNQVIKNETTAWHGRNLITSSKTGDWICPTCNGTAYDNGSWRCASEATVSYYMDPRNFLYNDYIFQFEDLAYNGGIQTVSGVEQIIKDVAYMKGNKITYKKPDGTTGTINKSYAQVIMDAAKTAGISPYHLASRIRQEQGTGSEPGSTATGTYGNYVGYYNFLNINASGSNEATIIQRGLQYAKDNNLDNPQKSIEAGAMFLAKSYIGIGQSTLYLQKFDVDDSDDSLYYHQYMQNVQAAVNEGMKVKDSYSSMGMLNSSINFVIPVYENMPSDPCPMPGTQGIVTQNVQVTEAELNVRKSKNTESEIVAKLKKGDKILRIEIGYAKENGYCWDKVVLADGKKGYIASNYVKQIDDITNCNDSVIANTDVNLRNGPGTSGTSIITTLIEGQALTRIETGKYNGLDGYNWDRVKLSDGRQGYLVSSYIDKATNNSNGNTNNSSNKSELVKVVCGSGLKVREKPNTTSGVLTILEVNEIVTRVSANVGNEGGYIWDKIVTGTGVSGYVARGDSEEKYIEEVSSGSTTGGSNSKISGNNIVAVPGVKIENLKKDFPDIVIKKDGKEITGNVAIGTGYTVTTGGKTYTMVVRGDVSGDGKINSTDLLKIQKHLLAAKKLSGSYQSAADVNGDGKINSTDLLKIQKYLLNGSPITL